MKKTNRNLRARAAARRAALPNLQSVAPARLGRIGLLSGTAIATGAFAGLAGMVALPTPAMAACTLNTETVTCADASSAYFENGINTPRYIDVVPGAVVSGGIRIQGALNQAGNPGTTSNVDVIVRRAFNERPAAIVNGDTTYGFNIVSSDGWIKFLAEEGTSITGGSGNVDGIRLRTSNNRSIEMDLSGNVTSGALGEAIDARAQGTGDLFLNLRNGQFTGTASDVIVVGADGGLVEVDVASLVTISGGNDPGDHGLWVITSTESDVQFAGKIANVAGNGIHVGNDAIADAGTAAKVDLEIGSTGEIIAGGTGVFVGTTTSGNVTITNYGHVEGANAGMHVRGTYGQTTGSTTINNHSYASTIGATGLIVEIEPNAFVNNRGGLILGTSNEGLLIEEIFGSVLDDNGNAVVVRNGGVSPGVAPTDRPGVIAGNTDGIRIDDVWEGNVLIDNSGYLVGDATAGGGLIIGVGGDGIDIEEADGRVVIDNRNTQSSSITGPFDPLALGLDEGVLTGLLSITPIAENSTTLVGGIWGLGGNGIIIEDVGDDVWIDNRSGITVGGRNDGINVSDVSGLLYDPEAIGTPFGQRRISFYLQNGRVIDSPETGLVWGRDDGIDLDDMRGSVIIDNGDGTIFGRDEGINIDDVRRGNVVIENAAGGLIQGQRGDAINIEGVRRGWTGGQRFGGHVQITNDGRILGGDSAIRIDDARTVGIANSGLIIGDGRSGQAVIELEDLGTSSWIDGRAGDIVNSGIIASNAFPGFTYSWGSVNPTVIPASADLMTEEAQALIWADLGGIAGFVLNPGRTLNEAALEAYRDAANDDLIRTDDGGATSVRNANYGLLVGRINLDGRNDDLGNIVTNQNVWLVRGSNTLRSGGEGDSFVNESGGWIQTAFGGWDRTSFSADSFNNFGIISLVDGDTRDRTTIEGNYIGGGLLALDVNLESGRADRLQLRDGTVTGETGIIVRLTEAGGTYGTEIDLVSYDQAEYGYDVLHPADAAFFLSSASDNYIELGGTPYIEDGLLAWFLQNDTEYDEFELVAGWGPGAVNAPRIITGAQTVFYETLGVVEDHIYGGQFAAGGGGGADLLYLPEAESGAPAGRQGGVWAKATGSWTDRDTTVSLDGNPDPFDTSSEQDVYSVIGGVDFKPGGIGSPFRIGVFGGYVASDLSFALGEDGVVYEGGLVGAYAAYNDGALFADVTVKADLLNATYSFFDEEIETGITNYGAAANLGYRFDLGNAAFFEPVASIAYVTSEIDEISGGGGVIAFENGSSLRAGIGAKIGTTIATGDMSTELSLLGKLWNEFEDANTVTVSGPGNATFTDGISGAFGEVAATATVTSADGGLSGFVSANGKFGEDFSSYGASAGLRVGF